ncbi:MAG: DUF423 domain-containing protein [Bacteroidota bacterium]
MQKQFLVFSGFSGAIAVAFGAMGAHFLKSKLESGLITEINLYTFETAVKYHIYHTLVLLIIALLADKLNTRILSKAGYCFIAGIFLFSGSLYLLSTGTLLGLTNLRWLGPITPVGGLCFISGWVLIAVAGMKKISSL